MAAIPCLLSYEKFSFFGICALVISAIFLSYALHSVVTSRNEDVLSKTLLAFPFENLTFPDPSKKSALTLSGYLFCEAHTSHREAQMTFGTNCQRIASLSHTHSDVYEFL